MTAPAEQLHGMDREFAQLLQFHGSPEHFMRAGRAELRSLLDSPDGCVAFVFRDGGVYADGEGLLRNLLCGPESSP